MSYIGNITEDATIDFKFATNNADGASVTYTGGTVRVRKGTDTTGTTAGITVTKDHNSKTGQHHVTILTNADAYYATGEDYTVSLDGATIDGQTVNAPIAEFSIENRFDEVDTVKVGGSVIQQADGFIRARNEYDSEIATTGADMNLANDAITAVKYDESTAYPLKSADTGATQVARVGADGDTLETLSDQIDGANTVTPPTVSQLNARTLLAASYFDPATDEVTTDSASRTASKATGFAVAGSAMTLEAGERNSIAAAHLDLTSGVETGVTVRQAMQRIGAVVAGKASGAGTGTELYVGLDGVTLRVTGTVDDAGNRTEVVYV